MENNSLHTDNTLKAYFNHTIKGTQPTIIKDLHYFYIDNNINRQPIYYDRCLVFVLQGQKNGYYQNQSLTITSSDYLLISGNLPFTCGVYASSKKPTFGFIVEIKLDMLLDIISTIDLARPRTCLDRDQSMNKGLNKSVKLYSMKDDIAFSFNNLLHCLEDNIDSKVIGEQRMRELIYFVLKNDTHSPLFHYADKHSYFVRIQSSVNYIQSDLKNSFNVDELAKKAQMSTSNYHKKFKQITGESPLQFIKKTRLAKAKKLIETQNIRASHAAQLVGYTSIPQFSREFKRTFGIPPSKI